MPSRLNNRYGAAGIAATLILALGFGIARAAETRGGYQGVMGFAHYLINVPPDWNGGLVLFAHGYEGEGSGAGTASSEPLETRTLTRREYAWASSGYRAWGYRPDWFLLDLLELRAHQPLWPAAVDDHPRRIYGRAYQHRLSRTVPEIYQGALITCGVIDGVGLTDWLYAYTAAAEYFSGLPLLDTPRPELDTLANGPWLGLTPCSRSALGCAVRSFPAK